MDAQRLCVKVHLRGDGADGPDTGVAADDLIPVFHDWIKRDALSEAWIDVHDYGHVPEGPGVLLVALDANYGLDSTGGATGLLYQRKMPREGELADRVRAAVRDALAACRELEAEAALGGRLRFRGERIDVVINDRLRAPNEDATLEATRADLDAVLAPLYDGAAYTLTRDPDPRHRFGVAVEAEGAVEVQTLLDRLG